MHGVLPPQSSPRRKQTPRCKVCSLPAKVLARHGSRELSTWIWEPAPGLAMREVMTSRGLPPTHRETGERLLVPSTWDGKGRPGEQLVPSCPSLLSTHSLNEPSFLKHQVLRSVYLGQHLGVGCPGNQVIPEALCRRSALAHGTPPKPIYGADGLQHLEGVEGPRFHSQGWLSHVSLPRVHSARDTRGTSCA